MLYNYTRGRFLENRRESDKVRNPFDDYNGKDAQLEKAVEVLKAELKNFKPLPPTPADPVKN